MGLWNSKFDYGTHETELLKEDSQAETQKHTDDCGKSHENYIIVNDFTINHLPENYRERDIFELIKTMTGLTIKITVKYCSLNRSTFWLNTQTQYPGYESRGKDSCFTGSGRIADVFQDDKVHTVCQCTTCKSDVQTVRELWTILVFTATHVVFDSSEAVKTRCTLSYFNDEGETKLFYGVRKRWKNESGDLCLLECTTCDRQLAEEIGSKIKAKIPLWKGIRDKYLKDTKLKASERKYSKRLVAIVSHPHGGDKKISIGMLTDMKTKWLKYERGCLLIYDACTCPGSSGAPVYLYGMDWFDEEFVHSGSDTTFKVNYSTSWFPG